MDKKFINDQNINILYEILLQELKINEKSIWIPQIKQIFSNNINFFLANVNLNNSLLELNKLFLKQTIIAINTLIPNLKNDKKINILPDEINFPHKIEDIKNIKKDLFDEEFNLKKKEFDDIMKTEKPGTINFSDEYRNEKIVNMQKLLYDKINERDNEVPQISNVSEINNILENINLKHEDLLELSTNINQPINVDSPISIEIDKNPKKKVNFNLKEDDEIIFEMKNTMYEEQRSIELPKNENNEVMQNMKNIKNNSIITNFLPMNEFIKKINEIDIINKKIDNLTNLVEQLIKIQYDIQQQKQQYITYQKMCENETNIN
jgi:hypothetical protein